MYELVNTSIPNGLLPGTHGFSTVAMTKGLPDSLRIRLETLCAYRHRTNAHDATYERENPVNWFHVILPQGVHAVGCVAPADFDYTGRTNRLARICALGKDEMPSVGGVAVLKNVRDRFREPWSGEARWLDADTTMAKVLQSICPAQDTSAPAWRKMFGDADGLRWAKQFTALLASNMSSGSKSIFFKTSMDCDADGTVLLDLFADLIAMLPPGMKEAVSFATYPDAFPNGTPCHLRGVYDSDRTFETVAATSPWIDCTAKKVCNENKLPPLEVQPIGGKVTQMRMLPRPALKPSVTPKWQGRTIDNTPNGIRSRLPYLPSPETGTKKFLFGIIATVVTLVIVAVVAVAMWVRRDVPSEISAENSSDVGTNTDKDIEQIKPLSTEPLEPTAKETKFKSKSATNAVVRARPVKIATKDKAEQAKAKKNKAEEQRRKEIAVRKARENAVAFTNATTIQFGIFKLKPETVDDKFKGKFIVFYYRDGTMLTNGVARYDAVNNPLSGKVANYKLMLGNEEFKESRLRESPCRVWYGDGVAWYEFQSGKKANWFENADSADLRRMCFGDCQEMYDTWKRHKGIKYKITVWESGRETAEWQWCENVFINSHAIDLLYRNEFKEQEDAITAINDQIKRIDDQIKKIDNVDKKKKDEDQKKKRQELEGELKEAKKKLGNEKKKLQDKKEDPKKKKRIKEMEFEVQVEVPTKEAS